MAFRWPNFCHAYPAKRPPAFERLAASRWSRPNPPRIIIRYLPHPFPAVLQKSLAHVVARWRPVCFAWASMNAGVCSVAFCDLAPLPAFASRHLSPVSTPDAPPDRAPCAAARRRAGDCRGDDLHRTPGAFGKSRPGRPPGRGCKGRSFWFQAWLTPPRCPPLCRAGRSVHRIAARGHASLQSNNLSGLIFCRFE